MFGPVGGVRRVGGHPVAQHRGGGCPPVSGDRAHSIGLDSPHGCAGTRDAAGPPGRRPAGTSAAGPRRGVGERHRRGRGAGHRGLRAAPGTAARRRRDPAGQSRRARDLPARRGAGRDLVRPPEADRASLLAGPPGGRAAAGAAGTRPHLVDGRPAVGGGGGPVLLPEPALLRAAGLLGHRHRADRRRDHLGPVLPAGRADPAPRRGPGAVRAAAEAASPDHRGHAALGRVLGARHRGPDLRDHAGRARRPGVRGLLAHPARGHHARAGGHGDRGRTDHDARRRPRHRRPGAGRAPCAGPRAGR